MTIHHLREALHHLHRVLDPSGDPSLTDGQLLARFVATRDEAAFAALMRRHGPMVLGVCRRTLRHTQDAEDAFQAAFLVLVRKAASVVEQRALGSWLYRVAYRIALEAKARNDKRRAHEKQVDELPHPSVLPSEMFDWRRWLDHELNLLPERYRAVLVVCDLEERSRKEAARLLDLAEGTVSSRLARGRRLLAKRLSRYGLSLSAATWTAVWSHEASAAVPLALTSATLLAASGRAVVSASVGFLTKGALKAMFLSKLKWTVGAVMIAAALGATSLAYRTSGPISFGQATAAPADKEDSGKAATELEILRREVELLKLKLEVVQEKQRAQEAELRSLRTASGGATVWTEAMEVWLERSAALRPQADEKARSKFRILKEDGTLAWPPALQKAEFNDVRKRFTALVKEVEVCFRFRKNPSAAMLNDLLSNLLTFQNTLDANVGQLSEEQYIEAKRYLRALTETITSLKDPNVAKQWIEQASRAPDVRPDGKIIRIDARGLNPYINLGSEDHIKPQLKFTVHGIGPDGRPNPQSKGTLEVVTINPHLSQTRVISAKEPIREGDVIYNMNSGRSIEKNLSEQARLLNKEIEKQVQWQEAEAALKALREARDPKEKQRAADELEAVLKKLREELGRAESGSQRRR
jgi:RNA polymerase sigma factor (sigma-70 family)